MLLLNRVNKKQKKGNLHLFSMPQFFLIIFMVFILPSLCLSAPKLVWDANQEEDLEGYNVYYKFSQYYYHGRSFDEIKSDTYVLNVGDTTCCSLKNFEMEVGMTYTFVVSAYNPCGESGNSNPRSYTVKDLNRNNVPDYLETTNDDPSCEITGNQVHLYSKYYADDTIDNYPDDNDWNDDEQNDNVSPDNTNTTNDDIIPSEEDDDEETYRTRSLLYWFLSLFLRGTG